MINIQVEELSAVKKKIVIEVPEDQVSEKLNSEYRDLKKNVQLRGFRRGKVPIEILKGYFKEKVQADAIKKLIDETLMPGLTEKEISPVSIVNISPETVEDGKPFKYTAEIEVQPKVDVQGYSSMKLTRRQRKVEDSDVDQRLEQLREAHGKLNPIPVSRGVKEGDYLTVDVEALVGGQQNDSLTVKDYFMQLGRNFYLPDFDSNLYGLMVEETRKVTVNFPEDFPRKGLAGKIGEFRVTVREAKERISPGLDDDFAKDIGNYDSLEALKDDIREDLKNLFESRTNEDLKKQISDLLIENNEIDVPDSMVENQIDSILRDIIQNQAAQGIDPNRIPMPSLEQRNQVRPVATRVVKVGTLLLSISERENITVAEDELQAEIEERSKSLGVAPDMLRSRLTEHDMLDDFQSRLLQDKVFKFILNEAEITDQEVENDAKENGEQTEEE
jgi:trigger factor